MQNRTYKNYLITLLMVIMAFNFVDRNVLGVVLQDIKLDLDLTDTQLGLLSGIAFALFYSVMGIPIARWADIGNRVTIITLTTALWSIAVALCGLAGNFAQLLLIRIGIGVGEAGCVPTAHSLIADYFTRAERPRAVARYTLGAPLSLIIGYFAGGWLNELYGWRVTFIIVGLPGVVLAVLAALSLKEPRYSTAAASVESARAEPHPTMREVIVVLWKSSTFRHLLMCFSVWFFFGYGILQWQPTFFIRSHHLSTGELGVWLALVHGVSGLIGIYLGGEWGARYAANNERRQLFFAAVLFSVFGLFNILAYLVSDYRMAFAILAASSLGGNMAQGPVLATIQTLVQPRMRAMSLALLYLFSNLIGMGLGPLAAGALSDLFRHWAGEESLRYALIVFSPGYVWAAWHAWRASRTVGHDVAAVHASLGNDVPAAGAVVASAR